MKLKFFNSMNKYGHGITGPVGLEMNGIMDPVQLAIKKEGISSLSGEIPNVSINWTSFVKC